MPANENISIRGGYVPFMLKREYNTNTLGTVTDKIAQQHERALEKSSAIQMALAQLDLNPAEDEWKTNYVNDIQNQIDDAARFGNYSTALSTAITLSGDVLSDPALRGRIRAQEDFKKKTNEILARQDLNQVTKDRWLEQNPYRYEDKYDSNGNVIGGTEWKPQWNPIGRYDMTRLYELTKSLAAQEAGGGESATFLDENGNMTSDPSKGFYGMAVKKGNKWERLSEAKLQKVFNSLFKQAPEAMDALMQDMDDRHWEYNKATDEGKKAFIGSDIMKEDGTFRTPEEYLSYRVNPILSSMAYNRSWSTVDYGDAYARRAAALEKQKLASQLDSDNPTTLGKAIEIDMSERAGAAGATLQSAMKELGKLFPRATLSNAYKRAISNGDYKTAAGILQGSINPKNTPEIKQSAMNYINLLRTEGEIYNNLTSGFTKEEKDALAFINSVDQGSNMPNAAVNKFSRTYANKLNELFGVKTIKHNSSYSGKVPNTVSESYQPASKIAITFRSDGQKEYVLSKLNNIINARTFGVSLGKINGEDAIIIDKNTTKLNDVATAFTSFGTRLIPNSFSSTTIYRLDGRGNIMKKNNEFRDNATVSGRAALNLLSNFSEDNPTFNKAKTIVDNAFSKKSTQKLIEPVQLLPFDNHNTLILREMRDKGYISPEEYNNRIKEYKDNNLKEVIGSMSELNNYKVWGASLDDPTNQVRLSQDEVREYAAAVLQAYDGDKENGVEIHPGEEPTGKGYGTTIIIRPQAKSGSKPEIKGRILYVDGLLSTKAAEHLANTPGALSRREYKINKIAKPTVADIYGRNIIFDDNEINYKRFDAAKQLDEAYNILALAKQSGETFTDAQAETMAKSLVKASGTVNGTVSSSVEYIKKKLKDYYNNL